MKLVLTGGGESDKFSDIDTHFIQQLSQTPTLLFIPLAGDESSWDDGLERMQSVFSTIEFDNIEMCIDLTELDWKYLRTFDAIYFDGGNTFDLMSMIRDTHTYELLHRFLTHGGIINGDSAGAIVLGSHLETAHFGDSGDENESEVTSYQGLNLIGSWAIHCHYTDDEDEEIIDFSNDYGFPILALHENTAVYIENRLLTVIGVEKASIFYGQNKLDLQPGDTFELI